MNEMIDQIDTPKLPNVGMDALTRAEIDMQISTAHAYPRSLSRVSRSIKSIVTLSKTTAAGCVYSLPRGGKPIVGPSIRMAEILFSQWGNCTGGSRTVEVNKREGYVEAEGVFHDLETNAKTVRRVRRRITDKKGQVFSDDMIIVTSNAAGSIAFRNAVLAGVPRAIWGDTYDEVERLLRGDIKTLPERRDEAFKAMAAFGLSAEDVCQILGVGGTKDIDLDGLVTITGLYNALKDGETTAEKLLAEVNGEPKKAPVKKSTKPKAEEKKAEPEPDPVVDQEEIKKEPEPEPKSEEQGQPQGQPEQNPDLVAFTKLWEEIEASLLDGEGVEKVKQVFALDIQDLEQKSQGFYATLMEKIAQYEGA